MNVSQIYNLVNTAAQETAGLSAVVAEDLSNLVDIGNAIFDANAVDNYVRSLCNVIGRTMFDDRAYTGRGHSIRKDAWTYGSVLRKIRVVPVTATENESWQLTAGSSYDPNVFAPPTVVEKFYNKKSTYEVRISLTDIQVRESFQSAEQMGRFIGMIQQMIRNVMERAIENLSLRAVNNMIGETIYDDYGGASLSSKSGVKAVNVLYLYKQLNPNTTLTADTCIYDGDFLRFAAATMKEYRDKLTAWTALFNVAGVQTFTPLDRMKTMVLGKFDALAGVYLYDAKNQFLTENIKLPAGEIVPYWQGVGTDFEFDSVSAIDIKTASNNDVEASGILAVMFDDEAVMVCNDERRTTTGYNPAGEFMNYFYKNDASYYNDLAYNFVVFFVA